MVLLAFFSIAIAPLASAQDVAAWFSKSAKAQNYSTIRGDIDTLAASLRSAGLLDSLLASRLEEGSRKNVPPKQMLDTLRVDSGRAVSVASMLRAEGLFPDDKKSATSEVEQALIMLRAGFSEDELRSSLKQAAAEKGKNESAVSRALAALAAVASTDSAGQLSESDRLAWVLALISSDSSSSELGSAAKLMYKARLGASEGSSGASTDSGKGASAEAGNGSSGSGGGGSGNGGSSNGHSGSGHGKK